LSAVPVVFQEDKAALEEQVLKVSSTFDPKDLTNGKGRKEGSK
jgi:hypothetical protein